MPEPPGHEAVLPLIPASPADVCRLLASALACLGPCTPLPALYEERLRAQWGGVVGTARMRQATVLLAALHQYPVWRSTLAALLADAAQCREMRLLAATLLLGEGCPLPPSPADESATYCALANLRQAEHAPWYASALEHGLARAAETPAADLPDVLTLLCFLRGLRDATLTDAQFAACVMRAGVLHPAVAARHPWRRLHRLLDYLGLADEWHVRQTYRRLVAEIWPQAAAANWAAWQWITVPGGPEVFPRAVAAWQAGERTIVRLHELKYAPLPRGRARAAFLAQLRPALRLLVCWLRPDTAGDDLPGGRAALRWLSSSNQAAATIAYAEPDWWRAWLCAGLPAAREAMGWLQEMPLPGEGAARRVEWLEAHLLPGFRRICANLLLARAAEGEQAAELVALAASGDLSAVRALALLPAPSDEIPVLLSRWRHHGGRPLQSAARQALDHLAHRHGLPDADELERQHLLAAAWDLGPLAGERVRVGWQVGGYRLRVSLQAGTVQLDALGPRGPLARLPENLRRSEAYRAARAAQRETQRQYRLFRERLERDLLDARPIAAGEFRYLLSNAIFAHLAERLVWITGEGDALLWAAPERWEDLSGQCRDLGAVAAHATLTPAHPVTLAVDLPRWQAVAVDRRLTQPFKQLFREIYTAAGDTGLRCARFAGRRLETHRAYALLRAAGFAPGAGVARRDWPGGLTAHLCWAEGAVSHDLFGPRRVPIVATGDIYFTHAGELLPLAAVDPIVFSETLRAADLLTTRAAPGEAEPTSRETLALRATLLREVARSFRLTNIVVPEAGAFALVLGARATYRLNLASGAVLLEPEGRQVTLPQHGVRWRLSEDGDATGEILALALALAHDADIDDLAFLAQLPAHPAQ